MITKFWRRLRDQECGFTLLETVLAVFIAGTVVIGSVVLMGTAVRTSGASSGSLDLQQLVQSQIESIQQLPYSATGDYPLLPDEDIPIGTIVSFETSDSGTNYQFPNPDGALITNTVQKVDVTAADEGNSVSMSFYKIIVP